MVLNVRGYLQGLLTNTLQASHGFPRHLRVPALRALGITVGPGSAIGADCKFIGRYIALAPNVFIGTGTYFDAHHEWVRIGADTAVGPQVLILTSTHAIGPPAARVTGGDMYAPVTIGRGCWIGARATILPGVSIGDGCVIAAGSVVTTDCEPNGLYAGVPASRKRDLPRTSLSSQPLAWNHRFGSMVKG